MSLAHPSLSRIQIIASLATALLLVHSRSAPADEAWTLIAVPDTQHYVDRSENVDDLMTQMEWIADHVESHDIAFVTQLGDLVQHGDELVEWDRAEAAMDIIDGEVPYSLSIGDHDYRDQEDRASGASEYVRRFGAARYAGRPWYGGASPDQKSHYQLFSAGGRQFLHLNLEWEAPGDAHDPDSPLGWAKQVLDTHPALPTIISTHAYIWDKVGEKGRTNGVEEDDGDGSSAERLWFELIHDSPQVFMVLNGNFHKATSQYDPTDPSDDPAGPSFDGEYHQVSYNLHGLPVYEMLSNYQDYPNGGDGWIRIIQFQPGAGTGGQDRISVQTYSTTHDVYQTDEVSQFHFDLDFGARFDDMPAPLPLRRAVFDTGEDTFVWQKNAGTNYGQSSLVRVDSADSGAQQGLLRFDLSDGDIPADARVVSAQLYIQLSDPGSGFSLHRMQMPWSERTATWQSLDNGITADGTEAAVTADLVTHAYLSESESPAHSIFDVTDAVRAWHGGDPNHGWALLPMGPDKLNITSFQGSSLRPRLVVDYVLDGDGGGGPRVATVTTGEDTYIWRKQPLNSFGSNTRIRVDLSDGMEADGLYQPMQGLIRFDIPFGDGADDIPQGATITRAALRLRLTDSGHGVRMHRMLIPWTEDMAHWSCFVDGIDDDDVEAASTPDLITEDYLVEPSVPGHHAFDVTEAVRAWHGGAANHGWVLMPMGDDKLIIESFQGSELTPELEIHYELP